MRLTTASQIPFEDIPKRRLGAIIAASGYEARATHAARLLNETNARRRIAFAFTNNEEVLSRPENERVFRQLGYELPATNGSASPPVDSLIQDVCATDEGDGVAVVVDYSSMSRIWYASLLRALWSVESGPRCMDVYLVYTPADYAPPAPTEGIPLDKMEPLPGFSGLEFPNRPNALIAGLGYDKHTALALYQRLEPASGYAMYADPGSHPDYVRETKKNNRDFLNLLPEDRVFTYDFGNLDIIAMMLNSLVSGLIKGGQRIILAPLGPKPFCMLSLVIALREKTVDVWRVSAGVKAKPVQRRPSKDGNVLAFWVRFER